MTTESWLLAVKLPLGNGRNHSACSHGKITNETNKTKTGSRKNVSLGGKGTVGKNSIGLVIEIKLRFKQEAFRERRHLHVCWLLHLEV